MFRYSPRAWLFSLFTLAAMACSVNAIAASPALFQILDSDTTAKRKVEPGVWRIEFSENWSKLKAGDSFSFPLPDDSPVAVTVSSVKTAPNGDKVVVGRYEPEGSMVMTVGKASVFANLMGPKRNYSISIEDGQAMLINQAKVSKGPIDLGDDIRYPPGRDKGRRQLSSQSMKLLDAFAKQKTTTSVIDVLVVYPPEFADLFGDPIARINQLIAFSNEAFVRSEILIELRLVRAEQIAFANNFDIGVNLDAATEGIGPFRGLRQLRDSVGADLVAVLQADADGDSASGVAWQSGDSAYHAVSVTKLARRCCDSVFTHEVGHNLGSGHVRTLTVPDHPGPCDGGFTGFSCGHANLDQRWGTIMSYLDHSLVGYRFSNLDSDCLGQPCGVAEGEPAAADNRSSFNLTRVLVEAFRATVDPDDPDPDPDPDEPNDNGDPPENGWLVPILDLLLG